MSWEDMMRRILPPTEGFSPHVTSRYGERFNRPEGSSNPHGGVDFNYNVGANGQRGINLQNPALRSPVDGVVENAGGGTVGKIAIRDKNGFLHEILHTQAQYVRVGEPVAAGQLIGAMGNTGVKTMDGRSGAHHVHYQLKDGAGRIMDPTAFADAQGPFDPNPAPPAYIPEYTQYFRDARAVPAEEVRILTRMPAGSSSRSAFDSEPVKVPNIGPASTLPPAAQKQFGALFGLWPPFSEDGISPDVNQTRQGQSDTPNNEDWSAMWRRRIGLP
ncbi:M23 family metallopeptidase [Bradyrhizobium diazoefficiens]|nr:M23 family metallopeptidase [Bradyrhizobium diazoefficiens]MBR0774442.1 M23 family metallopeptidase [Bradyrhizobium diazoefficiens]